jgi:hypothetical protein
MHFVNTWSSLPRRLTAQLDAWPAMSIGLAECGVGTGFAERHGGAQIVHLHGGDEVELRLTWPIILRMGDALRESGRVTITPGGDWVRVRLDTESDVELAMSLASVAVKAAPGAAYPSSGLTCQAAVPLPGNELRV